MRQLVVGSRTAQGFERFELSGKLGTIWRWADHEALGYVIPAEAGIQGRGGEDAQPRHLDARVRGHDDHASLQKAQPLTSPRPAGTTAGLQDANVSKIHPLDSVKRPLTYPRA